jgi:hypothetical protein
MVFGANQKTKKKNKMGILTISLAVVVSGKRVEIARTITQATVASVC